MATYTEITERLANSMATEIASDTDFAAALPGILSDAELRIYRELVPLALMATQTVPVAAGIASFATAADFIAARTVIAYTGTVRTFLLRRDTRFLVEYWPDTALRGVPKYWAESLPLAIAIAPPPVAASTTLELEYVCRPAALSTSVPTTWLSTNAPDLLHFACMVLLAGWAKNYGSGDDPQQAPFWEQRYQVALNGARKEEAQRRGFLEVPAVPSP